jgi:hypothetical protein
MRHVDGYLDQVDDGVRLARADLLTLPEIAEERYKDAP